jgi:Flp pilus assembly pilin Flp
MRSVEYALLTLLAAVLVIYGASCLARAVTSSIEHSADQLKEVSRG